MKRYWELIRKNIGRQTVKATPAKTLVSDAHNERPARVSEILSKNGAPVVLDNTGTFDVLQNRPAPPLQYSYDTYSCWKRGVDRAASIIENTQMTEAGAAILEVACGDGMVSAALSSYGHHTTLIDLEDWRDSRAKGLAFNVHNMANALPHDNSSFDVAFSYNSFEHIPDPEFALSEMLRVVRPGGFVFLDFDPLFASAWGLHAWRTLKMPYAQFLFSMGFVEKKINELGLYDLGKQITALQPLNQWRINEFRNLWKNSGWLIVKLEESKNFSELPIVEAFPQSFQGRGLVLDDLVVHGVRVLLQKPNTSN